MRLPFRIDTHFTALGTALCVALATMALPVDVFAEDAASGAAPVATSNNASVTTPDSLAAAASTESASPALAAAPAASQGTASDSTVAAKDEATDTSATDTQAQNLPADASANDIVLDDQVLSRQRGGAVGMVMVAAAPQLNSGNGVTLWDEIAPPTPQPIPVDAARAQQGSNVASYIRK